MNNSSTFILKLLLKQKIILVQKLLNHISWLEILSLMSTLWFSILFISSSNISETLFMSKSTNLALYAAFSISSSSILAVYIESSLIFFISLIPDRLLLMSLNLFLVFSLNAKCFSIAFSFNSSIDFFEENWFSYCFFLLFIAFYLAILWFSAFLIGSYLRAIFSLSLYF